MKFVTWLKKQDFGDTPEQDFKDDTLWLVKHGRDWPKGGINDWPSFRSYMRWQRSACHEAMVAGAKVWRKYAKFKREKENA